MSHNVTIAVTSGRALVAKDINGKSDPYFIIGWADKDGNFASKTGNHKSKYCKATLNPVWMEKPFSSTATTSAGVRIEVWDKDAIGSDEFMGYVFLDFAKLKNDIKPQYESVDLKPREGKKDKVTGSLFLNYTYYSSAWHQEYLAAEAKRKAEEEAAREKAAAERQAKIDEITSGDNHGLDASLAKKAAALLIDKPGAALKSGAEITEVLTKLGLIKFFTNMNVLMFNSKDNKSAVELHGNAQISEASAKDMENSPEMAASRNEFLMMLFDVNNDGAVDYNELALGITMQSNASNKERAEFYFDVFDKDKSGTLDRKEILKLNEILMRAMFGMVATGVASELMKRAEIRAVLTQSDIMEFVRNFVSQLRDMKLEVKITDFIFQKVDKDDSKEITKAEYVAFLDDEDAQSGLHALIASTFAQMKAKAGVIAQNEAMTILKRKYRI